MDIFVSRGKKKKKEKKACISQSAKMSLAICTGILTPLSTQN